MNAYDLYTFYIEPADLKGQAHKVKVESVEVAEVFNPGKKKNEKKIVLHFAGKKKALSLNKTRTGRMIEITGTPEIEQWVGVEIMIEAGKQSGKDTILINKASSQPAQKPPEQFDVITAFSELCKKAGIDQETRTAILRECGGDFDAAYKKVSERFKEILS